MLITSIFVKTYAVEEQKLTKNDVSEIKSTVETFIKEDYHFDGGNNIFSQVDNDDFKRYLVARNSYKRSNNAKDGYEVINSSRKYEFNYSQIERVEEFVKIGLDVKETNDYIMYEDSGKKEITRGASTVNDYTVILQKDKNSEWKVYSANIDIDEELDPIDGDYDVNSILGDSDTLRVEEERSTKLNDNVNNIENVISDIKEKESTLKDGGFDVYRNGVVGESYEVSPLLLTRRISDEGINRGAIYYYASLYWNRRNPNYLKFNNNCTNFASQALRYAGGRADSRHKINIDNKDRTWSLEADSFHLSDTYGDAWAQAHYLAAFMQRNIDGPRGPGGYTIKQGSNLYKGDLTFLYSDKDSKWFHTYIVVVPGSNFKIAANTKDRWMVPINECSGNHKRAYMHISSLN